LGKRADGYHELETLMISVGRYDSLRFTEEQTGEIRLRVFDAGSVTGADTARVETIPTGRDNLVVQAAYLLREYTGANRGARIDLWKRIPAAAGLAGGSSDAAATLVALCRLWNLRLTDDELRQLASQLGSDVGFFLSPTSAAICRGRGEKIESIRVPLGLHFVIARPNSGLSTALVYRHYRAATRPQRVDELAAALRTGNLGRTARLFHNALQPPAEQLNPEVSKLRTLFSNLPVLGHQMSGSGTGYFGLCASRRQAETVAARLRAAHIPCVFIAQCRP
jgi:4-diphosphocytidyl-2-C-methyl-D-erythritol kinase